MSTEKLSQLKAAAIAATPGPWGSVYDDWSDGDDALISSESRDGMVAIAKIEGGGPDSGYDEPFGTEQQANTAFIAAANPAAVLELLAELEAKDKRIAELEAKLAEPVSGGYKLVPVEPTENMIIDGFESDAFMALADAVNEKNSWPYGCKESAVCVEGIFKAMLAAAPTQGKNNE
ncbi:TPA: ead/Ea22-like family protein [Serratia marcescens]